MLFSKGSAKLAGPDHLRALAITLVLLFHYRIFAHPSWIDKAGSFGWTGVDLFFVLSGYLISAPLFKQIAAGRPLSLKEFFVKRVFRILPAYLTVLAVYVFFPVLRERETLAPLWKFLTFTQNYGQDIHRYGTFSHAWSLCVEEQFYLLLPFTMLLIRGRKSVFLVAGLFLLGFALRLYSWYVLIPTGDGIAWYKYMYYPTYTRLDGLLVGISIAGLRQFYPGVRSFFEQKKGWFLVTGLGLTAVAYIICLDPYSFTASIVGFPLVAIAYGCVLISLLSPKNRSFRVSSFIAALSYSLYLSHKIVIHLVQGQADRLGMDVNGTGMFVLCIVACIGAALLLRYAVEKPFMRWRDHVLKVAQREYPSPGIVSSPQSQSATIQTEESESRVSA